MKKVYLIYGFSCFTLLAAVAAILVKTNATPRAQEVCNEYSVGTKIPNIENDLERLKAMGLVVSYALGSSAEYDSRYILISEASDSEKPACTIEFRNGIVQEVR